jgi:hypothetical protein
VAAVQRLDRYFVRFAWPELFIGNEQKGLSERLKG